MAAIASTPSSQVVNVADDYNKVKNADKSQYRSLQILTKYEFDQVIGLRTMHLSRGAPPLIDIPDDYKVISNIDLREIAQKELLQKCLPYMIKRSMPNGKTEYCPLADLDLTAVRHLFRVSV